MLPVERLCFPLDYPTLAEAQRGAEAVAEHVGVFKVGLELFVEAGPDAVRAIQKLGRKVFLDLKLHDIPETVERAVARAAALGVDYLTVHAAGGSQMLRPAVARLRREGSNLELLAVTMLTSLSADDATELGFSSPLPDQALRFARLAQQAGVHGLVCSVAELATFRSELGGALTLVTPGIRPAGAAHGDQKRVGTPTSAIQAGASLLVVGRPIRDASDPRAAADAIVREIAAAHS
jgi:orotidine-5'-phosphate decarboxylase